MNKRIVIVIPASIPRSLTPNRSRNLHWGTITKAKNELQALTLVCAIDARNQALKANPKLKLPLEAGLLWYDLVIKDRRSILDDDNAIGGLKFCRDMLQVSNEKMTGAGIILNDRDFRTAQLHWIVDKKLAPRIVITVEGKC